MPRTRIAPFVLLLALGACGGEDGDRTAEPTPPGADVGATGADATATPQPPDSTAPGANP